MVLPPRVPRSLAAAAVALALASPAAGLAGPPAKAPSAAPSASAAPAAAPPPAEDLPPIDEATKLFDMATAAVDEGKFTEAEKMLLQVWEKKKTYDVATALGKVERRLGKHLPAAEHLMFALKNLPPSEIGATQKDIEAELALAKKEIGTLVLKANLKGAEVFLEGKSLGLTPAEPVFVKPGSEVHVAAFLEGFDMAKETLTISKGVTREVELKLEPKSRVPGIVVGSIGVAGLIAGGVLLGVSQVKYGEGQEIGRQIDNDKGYCSGPSPHPKCADLKAAGTASDTLGTAGFVALGAGVAAVIAGAYLLWRPAKTPTSASVRLAPAAAPGAGGLFVTGSF